MVSDSELRSLAVRDRGDSGAGIPPPPRRWLRRVGLPLALLAGFLGLVTWTARDALRPATPVTVMPVQVLRGASAAADTVVVTAAGWVEARPSPVLVSTLADGVIERVVVTEGEAVTAGQPLAYLAEADVRLELQQAEADVTIRQAELQEAQAAQTAADEELRKPLALQAALAEAEARLAKAQTDQATLPHDLRTAEARLRLAQQELDRKRSAGASVPQKDLARAESEVEAAQSQQAQLVARRPQLDAEVAALRRHCDVLGDRLRTKVAETRDLRRAQAGVSAAEGRLRQAQATLAAVRLRQERLVVRAPAAGKVLELLARPGLRVSASSRNEGHATSTLATLYDPRSLQVRADVRFEDLARVVPHQPARITAAALDRPLSGQVLFWTSMADVQKNTLSVKIALDDPPPTLRPDMLVQVALLAPPQAPGPAPAATLRILVPQALVQRDGPAACVWTADLVAGVARRTAVQTAAQPEGELIEITAGLNPASKLIVQGRQALRDGEALRIIEEQ